MEESYIYRLDTFNTLDAIKTVNVVPTYINFVVVNQQIVCVHSNAFRKNLQRLALSELISVRNLQMYPDALFIVDSIGQNTISPPFSIVSLNRKQWWEGCVMFASFSVFALTCPLVRFYCGLIQ